MAQVEGWAVLGQVPGVLLGCSRMLGLEAIERVIEAGVQLSAYEKVDDVGHQSVEEL